MKRFAANRFFSVFLTAVLFAAGLILPVSAAGWLPGDMDRDGKITAADARIVLRIAVGLESVEAYMDPEEDRSGVEIAVVTDVGVLMDHGYNQGIFDGAQAFSADRSLRFGVYQPGNGEDVTDGDRVAAMERAVKDGAAIVVTAGFEQAQALEQVAEKYPDVKFVFVDGWTVGPENVTAVAYKEEQAGFLAGYAAVREGYTRLGFMGGGGGENPAVNRYGYGFLQGVEAAGAELKVKAEVRWSMLYGETFTGSPELEALALDWYKNGTEVIFTCGGAMVDSVIAAAESTPSGKVIGVDVDQSSLSDRVVTSAMKDIGGSVEWVLDQYYAGKWNLMLGGLTQCFGAAEDSVGLPTVDWRFSRFTKDQYRALYARIKSGELAPKDDVPEDITAGWRYLTVAVET